MAETSKAPTHWVQRVVADPVELAGVWRRQFDWKSSVHHRHSPTFTCLTGHNQGHCGAKGMADQCEVGESHLTDERLEVPDERRPRIVRALGRGTVSPLVVGDDSVAITQCGYEAGPGLLTEAKSVDQHERAAVATGISNGEACIPTLERRPLHPNPPIMSRLCLDHGTFGRWLLRPRTPRSHHGANRSVACCRRGEQPPVPLGDDFDVATEHSLGLPSCRQTQRTSDDPTKRSFRGCGYTWQRLFW